MVQPADRKAKATALRTRGLSYGEIRKELSVSKSTLSFWLKNVPLPTSARRRLYTKQIQILTRGPKSQRERRTREVESILTAARADIRRPLSKETFRLLGAALYWAEGGKTQDLEITNSDPLLIAFMVRWFKEVFDIDHKTLKAHLNIYPQQNERDIKRFWSDITGIPIDNFGKSFIKPPNKGYKKNNLYYGTIRVRVPKGTDKRVKIAGWIQGALQDFIPNIESIARRWSRLKDVHRTPVNIRP